MLFFTIIAPLTYIGVCAGGGEGGPSGTISGQRWTILSVKRVFLPHISKNTDVAPSLLRHHVSAKDKSKPTPAILNPLKAGETTNVRAQVLLMDAGAARHHAVALNKIRGKHQAPARISKYILNSDAL